MSVPPSFGNGHILRPFSLVNFVLSGGGVFYTTYVDVSEFSTFNMLFCNSNDSMQVEFLWSLTTATAVADETCLIDSQTPAASLLLQDLGSYVIKSRFLRIRLTGTPGNNFSLQLVFRNGPTFSGLLEDVGSGAEVYIEGTPGDFRTLVSGDGSVVITQNPTEIDFAVSASSGSKWNEVSAILSPKTASTSIIAGGSGGSITVGAVNCGILGGLTNIVNTPTSTYSTIVGGNINNFLGTGSNIGCGIYSSINSTMNSSNTSNKQYCVIDGCNSSLITGTVGSTVNSGMICCSGGSITDSNSRTITSAVDIGGNGNDINVTEGTLTRVGLISSNGSTITSGIGCFIGGVAVAGISGGGVKTNCVMIGGNTNTMSGASAITNCGIYGGSGNTLTANSGGVLTGCSIFGGITNTISGTSSNNSLYSSIGASTTGAISEATSSVLLGSSGCTMSGGGSGHIRNRCAIIGGLNNTMTGSPATTSDSGILFSSGTDMSATVNNRSINKSFAIGSLTGIVTGTDGTIDQSGIIGTNTCSILKGSNSVIAACDNSSISGTGTISSCLIAGSSTSTISNTGNKSRAVILGGSINQINGTSTNNDNTIIGGNSNQIGSTANTITRSTIIGSLTNTISSNDGNNDKSFILGSNDCSISIGNGAGIIGCGACTISGTGNKRQSLIIGSTSSSLAGTTIIDTTVILGGNSNTITNSSGSGSGRSVIIGGQSNTVSGAVNDSIVGGTNATAAHSGCFIYSTGTALSTSVANQTTFKSAGGTRIFSNDAATLGVSLAANATAWAVISDAAVKENFVELDEEEVMDKVMNLPTYRYNYIGAPSELYCYGTCAQDWHSQFPYPEYEGTSSKATNQIDTGDLMGIMLTCIKRLKSENDGLRSDLDQLRSDFEAYVSSNNSSLVNIETEIDLTNAGLSSCQSNISSLDTRVGTCEGNIVELNDKKLGLSIF